MKKKLTGLLLVFTLCTQAQNVRPYDVIIDEIMADPSPVVALPNAEFVELRNVSPRAVNLNGWRLGDANGFCTISTGLLLPPDSCVIICASSAATLLAAFGKTIAVSNFPSLNNDGGDLYLRSKEGTTIHAVAYRSAWYQNAVKSQGGWTLEMIDRHNACSGSSNWTASNDPSGGTPGRINSVDGINEDQQPPVLLRAFAADSLHVLVTFNEPLDSLTAAGAFHYTISDAIGVVEPALPGAPFFNTVQLRTSSPLERNKVYTITANNVTDCAGNSIGAYNKSKLGRSSVADTAGLVINEILFNPLPDGADYVELYNRSVSNIDLKDCYIGNRVGGSVGAPKQISADNRLLFPGEYMVVTDNAAAVKRQYLAKAPDAFAEIGSMPSYPDDKGDVVVVNAQGKIIDELAYDENWQFKLIDNDEGVALERIDYNKPTQDAGNWHSAATGAGYGTPGYPNSQFRLDSQLQGSLTVSPPVFSPDNDGFNDFLTIQYRFPDPGYVCNITIFDATGVPVRYLTRNALCGPSGSFRWDGLNENAARLPIGVYVVVTEVFNLKGKTKHFKQAVTLARRLS